MKLSGPNLYRVYYRVTDLGAKDVEYNAIVVAHSEKEAESYLKDYTIVKTMLVDSNVTMVIPKQYLKEC